MYLSIQMIYANNHSQSRHSKLEQKHHRSGQSTLHPHHHHRLRNQLHLRIRLGKSRRPGDISQ